MAELHPSSPPLANGSQEQTGTTTFVVSNVNGAFIIDLAPRFTPLPGGQFFIEITDGSTLEYKYLPPTPEGMQPSLPGILVGVAAGLGVSPEELSGQFNATNYASVVSELTINSPHCPNCGAGPIGVDGVDDCTEARCLRREIYAISKKHIAAAKPALATEPVVVLAVGGCMHCKTAVECQTTGLCKFAVAEFAKIQTPPAIHTELQTSWVFGTCAKCLDTYDCPTTGVCLHPNAAPEVVISAGAYCNVCRTIQLAECDRNDCPRHKWPVD